MKIICECGWVISDSGDRLPQKAHLIPDQEWFNLLDLIDDAIEKPDSLSENKDVLCMNIRKRLGEISRSMYQCQQCGTVYIEDHAHSLTTFTPARPDSPSNICSVG